MKEIIGDLLFEIREFNLEVQRFSKLMSDRICRFDLSWFCILLAAAVPVGTVEKSPFFASFPSAVGTVGKRWFVFPLFPFSASVSTARFA